MTLQDAPVADNATPEAADTSDEKFANLDLQVIVASLTNPRKHFNATKLQELADSIKAGGVHQPILVRPLPGSRVQDTVFEVGTLTPRKGPKPTHEVVAGERRFRASQMAGKASIPAMIRQLTDEQVLEIQIIENLQRDDLTELEEAEGYQSLMNHKGINADQVAEKIGKSRAYVYGRLKLLELCQEGKEALREGTLPASHALLVARIPDGKLQATALKEITRKDYYGDSTMSYRQAAAHVQEHYMLKLSAAKFSIKDESLLAGVGACKDCTKRTGANPDLFTDVKGADVCIDPGCYRKKTDAQAERERQEAVKNGQTIIDGREAKALMPNSWTSRVEGHLRLDDPSDSPTKKPLRSVLAKQMAAQGIKPVLVANPHKSGELVAVLPVATVTELMKTSGQSKAAADMEKAQQAEAEALKRDAAHKAKQALEVEWRWAVLEATWAKVQECSKGASSGDELDKVTRHLALRMANPINQDKAKQLCKLLELGKVAPREGLMDWVRTTPDANAALLLLTMFEDVEYRPWIAEHNRDRDGNEGLWLVAEAFKIDRHGIEAQVRANTRAAKASAKKTEKGSAAIAPAAQGKDTEGAKAKTKPKGGAKKATAAPAKLSAEDAQSGIAAAMQGVEAAASTAAGGEAAKQDLGFSVGGVDLANGESRTVIHPQAAWPFPV